MSFHLGYFNVKSDRLFSLDCDVQHRPEQATVFKVALPRDFPRIQRDVLSGSQKLPISSVRRDLLVCIGAEL